MFLLPTDAGRESPLLTDAGTGQRWSGRELAHAVESLADSLRTSRKQLVFVLCRNDAPTIISYLAAIEAGHAVALLDAGLSSEFLGRLVGLYQPDLVFFSTPPEPQSWLNDYHADGANPFRRRVPAETDIHPDLALLLSTSGSTGTPKFVRLTRRNVESNARSIQQALGLTPAERPISSLPVHYSYGLSVINSHLAAGAEIVMTQDNAIVSGFWYTFRTHNCTSWAGVPYSYQLLKRLDIDKLNIPSLTTLTQAGGKLNPDLIEHFHSKIAARDGEMFVMYGQTEAAPRIATTPAARLMEKLGSGGCAIPGGELSILTDEGMATDPGVTGEVIYRGPNVMMGYAHNRADLALGDVLRGCLHTGDFGYLDAEGFVYLTGRQKRDAKIFGLRLNMDEIEDMMRVHGPTAVISSGEKLVLFCEYGNAEMFSEYSRDLSAKLKVYAGAFSFRRIDRLPLKANGKIDYSQLENGL